MRTTTSSSTRPRCSAFSAINVFQIATDRSLWLRDREEEQLTGQILIYPVLGTDLSTASYVRNADAPCLTRAEMVFFWESFLGARGSPGWSDKYAVPLLATDYGGLPPSFLTAAAHAQPNFDLQVSFDAPAEVRAGETVALRGTLFNAGPDDVSAVTVHFGAFPSPLCVEGLKIPLLAAGETRDPTYLPRLLEAVRNVPAVESALETGGNGPFRGGYSTFPLRVVGR